MNTNVEALQRLYVKMGGNPEDVSDKTTISEMIDAITAIGIVDRVARSGNYVTATTAAEMDNEDAIYVYTGSEDGYNQGHLYYWDGTVFVDGGEYNGAKAEIDPTLSHTGKAADAKKTGDALASLNGSLGTLTGEISELNNFAGAISPNRLDVSGNNATNYGIDITFHDGKVTLNGTATASGVIKIGNIIPLTTSPLMFIGIPSGASPNTFGIRYIHGSTISDKYANWTIGAMTVGDTYDIYVKFANGYTFDNVTFELMATEDYTGEWVAFGDFVIVETCKEIVDDVFNDFKDITGYDKPNLFKNTIKSQTANGLTFTVNADKSVTITGTSTALTAPNAKFTLPKGKYLLNGCAEGSSQSYHIMLLMANGTSIYQYGGIDKAIEVTDDTEAVTLYLRVLKNQTINTVMRPMIRPASVYNPYYAPYGEYQIYKPIQQLIDYTQFNWSGKKMNVIGDSIVAGSHSNFINVIRDILCLSEARNYGVGGSCLASSSADADYPPAVLRYENMNLDAQIILVHAGTNDYSAQIPLGADDSTDITTFNGALNVMMSGLRDMYPTALIIFDNILHRFNDGALPIKASEYRACIENRCLANHIVFYDSYKYTGFDFVKGYYDHILTDDGLHPNQTGANILGRKLAGFIRWN